MTKPPPMERLLAMIASTPSARRHTHPIVAGGLPEMS